MFAEPSQNLPSLSDLIQKSDSIHRVQILWHYTCQLKETEIKNATKEILYQTFLPITYSQASDYILAANPHSPKLQIRSEILKEQTYFLNHVLNHITPRQTALKQMPVSIVASSAPNVWDQHTPTSQIYQIYFRQQTITNTVFT
jgi:hypothetical protein